MLKYLILIVPTFFVFQWSFAQSKPDDARILQYYQAQQYAEAADYIRGFYPDSIGEAAVLNQLGYTYRMARDYKQAERYYQSLFTIDSLHIPTLLNLGFINAQRGQQNAAEGFYRRIIAIDSIHVASYVSLASLMRTKGDTDEAVSLLKMASTLQARNVTIANDLATVFAEAQRFEEADSVLNVALAIDSENLTLLYSKSVVTEQLGNFKETVALCQRLIELDDIGVDTKTRLARAYFNLEEYRKCLETYKERNEAFGESLLGEFDYYYMAMSARALRRFEEGLVYIDKAVDQIISPNAGLLLGQKADLHNLANQPWQAVATYQRSFHIQALRMNYYALALVYDTKLADKKNAAKYFEMYLAENPPPAERAYVKYSERRLADLKQP